MKEKIHHSQKNDTYVKYYLDQAGSGMTKFCGGRLQKGYGLGGFFSSLVRGAVPLLKAGLGIVTPHALNAGQKILNDTL